MSQTVIFTDMDGTLLDHHTYSHEAADALLASLDERQIPVIPTTSKTFAELIDLRQELGNRHPFIVENGAAVCIPKGYFASAPTDTVAQGDYWVKAFVEPRAHWQTLLAELPADLRSMCTSYTEMGVTGVAELTGLPMAAAQRSSQRQFGEPVHWRGTPEQLTQFCAAVQAAGGETLVGGRFVHISGAIDKGKAVLWLAEVYAEQRQSSVVTVGLGDSGNDVAMLAVVDHAIVIPSPAHAPPQVARPEHKKPAQLVHGFGPIGWVEGVTAVLAIEQTAD